MLILLIFISLNLFLIILVFIFSFFFLWCISTSFFIFILFNVIGCFFFNILTLTRILILFTIRCLRSVRPSLVLLVYTSIWSLNLIDWCHIFRCSFSFFSINKLLLCLRSFRSINFCSNLSLTFGRFNSYLRFFFSFINLLWGLGLLLGSFLNTFDFFCLFRNLSLFFLFLLLYWSNFRNSFILFGLKNLFSFWLSRWSCWGIFWLPLLFSLSCRLFVFHGVSKLKTSPRWSKQILKLN